jgi:hypothetical protein
VTTRVHLNRQILDVLIEVEEALPLGKRFAVAALIDALQHATTTTNLNERIVATLKSAEQVLDGNADADLVGERMQPNRSLRALTAVRALLDKLNNGVVA